jgi:hypothetical protein
MRQLKLFAILLQPSFLSVVIIVPSTIGILIVGCWAAISGHLLLGYLSVADALRAVPASTGGFWQVFWNSQPAYVVYVLVVGVMVSVGTYLSLDGIEYLLAGVFTGLSQVQRANRGSKRATLVAVATRWVIRTLVAATWAAFTVLFIAQIVPFAIIAMRQGLFSETISLGYVAISVVMLLLTLHIHVIFMRLLVLRPRVFGDDAVVLAGLE